MTTDTRTEGHWGSGHIALPGSATGTLHYVGMVVGRLHFCIIWELWIILWNSGY